MRKTIPILSLAGALLVPALVSAQATVQLQIGLPVVLPQLVVVAPGVQVVPDMDEEVFFTNGFYWVHRDDYWYRSRDHRGWMVVPERGVPARIVALPPGQYKHWRGPAPAAYRGGGPGFRGGPGPGYRGPGPGYRGGPAYRGGPGPGYRGPGPAYRGGPGPAYRGGGPVRGGGEYRGGGEHRGGGEYRGGGERHGGEHGGHD